MWHIYVFSLLQGCGLRKMSESDREQTWAGSKVGIKCSDGQKIELKKKKRTGSPLQKGWDSWQPDRRAGMWTGQMGTVVSSLPPSLPPSPPLLWPLHREGRDGWIWSASLRHKSLRQLITLLSNAHSMPKSVPPWPKKRGKTESDTGCRVCVSGHGVEWAWSDLVSLCYRLQGPT